MPIIIQQAKFQWNRLSRSDPRDCRTPSHPSPSLGSAQPSPNPYMLNGLESGVGLKYLLTYIFGQGLKFECLR